MTRHAALCGEVEDAAGRACSVVVLMLGRRGGCYRRRAPFPAGTAVRMEKLSYPQLEGLHLFRGQEGSAVDVARRYLGQFNNSITDFDTKLHKNIIFKKKK